MSAERDLGDEMPRFPLDENTVDRLLAGRIAPEDAPAGFDRIAGLVRAASGPTSPAEISREAMVVAAVAEAARSYPSTAPRTPRRKSMLAKLLTAKAAAAVAALTLSAGAAAAATGNLPDAAQDGVAKAVSHVGINLPQSDRGKGAVISDKAKNDGNTGVDKGADVSSAASNGKSRAGQDHPSSTDRPTATDHPSGSAPVTTPNTGGPSTVPAASGAPAPAASGAPAPAPSGGPSTVPAASSGSAPAAASNPAATSHPSGRP